MTSGGNPFLDDFNARNAALNLVQAHVGIDKFLKEIADLLMAGKVLDDFLPIQNSADIDGLQSGLAPDAASHLNLHGVWRQGKLRQRLRLADEGESGVFTFQPLALFLCSLALFLGLLRTSFAPPHAPSPLLLS